MKIFPLLMMLTFLVSSKLSTAQKTNKAVFEVTGGAGISWFGYGSKTNRSKKITSEFRVGTYIRKPIRGNFSLLSGVLVGYKPKFYSYSFDGSMSIIEKVNYSRSFISRNTAYRSYQFQKL